MNRFGVVVLALVCTAQVGRGQAPAAPGQSPTPTFRSDIDLVALNAAVPAEVKARVDQVKAGLKDGSFVIWKGPIAGQDGKEVLARDKVADDAFLQNIKFYVKGVEGQVPAGK